MNALISSAIVIATVFGGTIIADRIYNSVRDAALEKSASGLPRLAPFTTKLSHKKTHLIEKTTQKSAK